MEEEENEVTISEYPCDRCGGREFKGQFYCKNCGSCQICGCCPCYRVGCEECQLEGRQENESVADYHARIDHAWELEIGEPLRNAKEQDQMKSYVAKMQTIVDNKIESE